VKQEKRKVDNVIQRAEGQVGFGAIVFLLDGTIESTAKYRIRFQQLRRIDTIVLGLPTYRNQLKPKHPDPSNR